MSEHLSDEDKAAVLENTQRLLQTGVITQEQYDVILESAGITEPDESKDYTHENHPLTEYETDVKPENTRRLLDAIENGTLEQEGINTDLPEAQMPDADNAPVMGDETYQQMHRDAFEGMQDAAPPPPPGTPHPDDKPQSVIQTNEQMLAELVGTFINGELEQFPMVDTGEEITAQTVNDARPPSTQQIV